MRPDRPVRLKTIPGERFGHGVVIDPEVRRRRVSPGDGRARVERCARLRCDCGTIYLAKLTELLREDRKARRSCGRRCGLKGAPGRRTIHIQRNKGGYRVGAYVGWVKSRREAEDLAARTRVRVLPPGAPAITGV